MWAVNPTSKKSGFPRFFYLLLPCAFYLQRNPTCQFIIAFAGITLSLVWFTWQSLGSLQVRAFIFLIESK
jgi:hypothetical protein